MNIGFAANDSEVIEIGCVFEQYFIRTFIIECSGRQFVDEVGGGKNTIAP